LADKSFFDCAFILGATIQNEMDRATAVLFDRAGRPIIARNFFLFSYDEDSSGWAIGRMDENHRYIYDQRGLQADGKSDPPIKLRALTEAHVLELENEAALLLGEIRRELIHLLKQPRRIVCQRLLIQEVRHLIMARSNDFHAALNIARRCYAALLIDDRTARKDYLEKPVNGLEDSALIGEALFLNAEILSGNRHVKRMGSYCSIPVQDKLS
jgi:hypothetical protein